MTNSVQLVWATPEGEDIIGYLARVSNNAAQRGDPYAKLIKYLLTHQHWSPFEMVNVCVQIDCPRDISRQILRHRSFSFQEFSGRYASYDHLLGTREGRLQDHTNRQNSITIDDPKLDRKWRRILEVVRAVSWWGYGAALDLGIAKEVARVLLPEGLVPTKMYMNGTLRSWIHYINIRSGPETQKEHRDIALQIKAIIKKQFPTTSEALRW
jgi:thymidylate synthase (FAD)